MSQENVEIAVKSIDAFNRRDVEALVELSTPDVERFPPMFGALDGGSFRGREGIEMSLEDVRKAWDEFCILSEEFRDLGDRVLMLGRVTGRGRESGVEVNSPLGAIYDFRGDKISRFRGYLDQGEALRAAGLEE